MVLKQSKERNCWLIVAISSVFDLQSFVCVTAELSEKRTQHALSVWTQMKGKKKSLPIMFIRTHVYVFVKRLSSITHMFRSGALLYCLGCV